MILSVHAVPPVHPDHPAELRWKQADADVYVATVRDEFAGFISVDGAAHALHGAHAQPLGVFRTQREARAALGAHLARSRTAAPRPASGAPGRRRRPRAHV